MRLPAWTMLCTAFIANTYVMAANADGSPTPTETARDFYQSLETAQASLDRKTISPLMRHALDLCDCAMLQAQTAALKTDLSLYSEKPPYQMNLDGSWQRMKRLIPAGAHFEVVEGSEKNAGDNATVEVKLLIDGRETSGSVKTIQLRLTSENWSRMGMPKRWRIYLPVTSDKDSMPPFH